MSELKELFQNGDWQMEKHVPVIEILTREKKGQPLVVMAAVGAKITHPNTAEHHIRWIELYFLPQGEKFPYQLARMEFSAHGESVKGAQTSSVYTEPAIRVSFKTEKSGELFASSYCNIHGLWESSKEIKVE